MHVESRRPAGREGSWPFGAHMGSSPRGRLAPWSDPRVPTHPGVTAQGGRAQKSGEPALPHRPLHLPELSSSEPEPGQRVQDNAKIDPARNCIAQAIDWHPRPRRDRKELRARRRNTWPSRQGIEDDIHGASGWPQPATEDRQWFSARPRGLPWPRGVLRFDVARHGPQPHARWPLRVPCSQRQPPHPVVLPVAHPVGRPCGQGVDVPLVATVARLPWRRRPFHG